MSEASHAGHGHPVAHAHAGHGAPGNGAMVKLAIGALGVVYGDIGTSPLYAVKECFTQPHGVAVSHQNVLGILSLIFWSLMLVIVVKYLTFIMRADNDGEGGILALLALVSTPISTSARASIPPPSKAGGPSKMTRGALVLLGIFGAALLYGDGMITPAISVLSAIEGLGVATHALDSVVVPITCGILIGLFLVQKRGTAKIGAFFGPATFVWFLTIAAIGAPWIVRNPRVLLAINPWYAVRFFIEHGKHGFLVLASVVLCITGGEALYADMGHFGKKPIRWAWYCVALPALLLNYFGQGALLMSKGAVENPFYELVSGWVLYPLVAIAAVATVVASQALISGAFSLTQQAVQLGYCPRVAIVHTSSQAEGQIYVPEVNNILMVACVALVLSFRESGNLAAAYGIAVTGTMSITSILFYYVARMRWGWSFGKAASLVALFLVFDLAFFLSNLTKFMHGGWFPVVIAVAVFTIMTTWKKGRAQLGRYMLFATLPLDAFMQDLDVVKPHRVKGTAVFMTSNPEGVPPVLLHHFKHNKVLHEQVLLLSVLTAHVPAIDDEARVKVTELGKGFYQVTATYGFTETPDVPVLLERCALQGLRTNQSDTSYFLGRETLLTSGRSGMARWRKILFAFLSRNARTATSFFQIPPNRVVEMGIQVEL